MRDTTWNERPVMVTVAPVGAETTRADNPSLPHTPTEIAQATAAAVEAGAAIAHLHAREDDGTPTHRGEVFAEIVGEIRARTDVICNVSTGGATWMSIDQRMECLEAGPEMAGVEAGSVNFAGDPFVTSRADAQRVIASATRNGIVLEAECFDLGHVAEVPRLTGEDGLPIALYNLVLGVPGGAPPTAAALQALAGAVPLGCRWTVTAVGRHQFRLLGLALLLGADGVRVGLEDGVYVSAGRLAASNAELVAQAVTLARNVGREVATVAEAREALLTPMTHTEDPEP